MTKFDEIGGEESLRAIIERFVDRCFDDMMIGFMFRKADPDRVKAKEFEHAAEHLGGPFEYTGRPIGVAHQAHRIMGGQYLRRRMILQNTLREFEVSEDIIAHWLGVQDRLRPAVTGDKGSECAGRSSTLPIK